MAEPWLSADDIAARLGISKGTVHGYRSAVVLLNQDANACDDKRVEFRLEELIPHTNQWRSCGRAMYLLKRSFTSDFDF